MTPSARPRRQLFRLSTRLVASKVAPTPTCTVLGSTALQVVNPQIVRTFIDAAASGSGGQKLIYAALAFTGIALLQQAVAVSASYVGENLAWIAVNALRIELRLGRQKGMVACYENLALIHDFRHERDKAEDLRSKARAIREEPEYPLGELFPRKI